jgi:SWI/SNF-related matrix-associated actin-dependent regulator 1 of chromatin subfamily A
MSRIPELKSYQIVGVNFLLLLHSRDVEGAILADEMGLGKTAQAICFLAAVRARRAAEGLAPQPHLVIAPASVLENWGRELATWAPALRCVTFHGAGRVALRRELEERMQHAAGSAAPPPPFDVLLCCYTAFERDTADAMDDRKWLVSGLIKLISHLTLSN